MVVVAVVAEELFEQTSDKKNFSLKILDLKFVQIGNLSKKKKCVTKLFHGTVVVSQSFCAFKSRLEIASRDEKCVNNCDRVIESTCLCSCSCSLVRLYDYHVNILILIINNNTNIKLIIKT